MGWFKSLKTHRPDIGLHIDADLLKRFTDGTRELEAAAISTQEMAADLVKSLKNELDDIKSKFITMSSLLNDGIILTDEHGVIQECTPSLTAIFPTKDANIVGTNIFTWELMEKFKSYVLSTVTDDLAKPLIFESHAMDSSGREVYTEITASKFHSSNGSLHLCFVIKNVTEQISHETDLRESLAFKQAVIDSVPHLMFVRDSSNNFIDINPIFKRWIDPSEYETRKRQMLDAAMNPQDKSAYFNILEKTSQHINSLFISGWKNQAPDILKAISGEISANKSFLSKVYDQDFEPFLIRHFNWFAKPIDPTSKFDTENHYHIKDLGLIRWYNELRTFSCIQIHHRTADDSEQGLLDMAGAKSALFVPIRGFGKLWGYFSFYSEVHREWTDTEIEAVVLISSIVGAAIEREYFEVTHRDFDLYKNILDNVNHGVLVFAARRLLYTNDFFKRLCGYTDQALKNVPLNQIITFDPTVPDTQPMTVIHRDGTHRTYQGIMSETKWHGSAIFEISILPTYGIEHTEHEGRRA